MMTLRERIAWYRAEQYLARYMPYCIAVAGTYGKDIASSAIAHAIRSSRHVRSGYKVEQRIDIPEGILGAKGKSERKDIFSLLVKSKMREMTQFEPDTIISQLPLLKPGAAPWAASRILPRMLVLTHVGLERVDMYVNKDMIAHEYSILATSLHAGGVVVLNADDEELKGMMHKIDTPVITYGLHPSADVRISRATRHQDGNGLFVTCALHGKQYEMFLPGLFAAQHISAVAAGLAAAHGLGVPIRQAIEGLQTMHPPKGSLSRAVGKNNSHIIDDSYTTCPQQLESSLKSFATLPCSGRKIAVLGDMEGLASYGIEKHEEAGRQASAVAPIIIFVGDMMRHAQSVVLKSGSTADTHHFASSSEAAAWLPENIREGDMVFISGGKSMKMGNVVQALKS